MEVRKALRAMLNKREVIFVPGAYDALTALIAESLGFKALYMGGWITGAHLGITEPRMTLTEMVEAAGDGRVRALYVMGENPMLSDADGNHVRHCLEETECLVVQDIFLTETAKLAHVVLSGASFAEKEGTYTNVERRVQRLTRVFDPLGSSKADWHIVCMLAQVMGYDFDYASPADIFKELTTVSPIHEKMSWADLGETGKRWQTV